MTLHCWSVVTMCLLMTGVAPSLSLEASSGGGVTRRNALLRPPMTTVTAALLASAGNQARAAESPATSTTLSDGSIFPLASFGLQVYEDATAYKLTLMALECGYRNFFASVLAGNQKGFAQAVRDSGIPRDQLYICGSVVSNRVSGYDAARKATQKGCLSNLQAFGAGNIDYLDQIMLDYPGPDAASIQGQWSAFQEMHDQKVVKSLSVSNFSPAQLDAVLQDERMTVKPVVNQLPYSVAYHPPNPTYNIEENAKRGVLVQAWAPLGYSLGGRFSTALKQQCAQIGQAHGNKTWAQVALRWVVQHGASFTMQTQKKSHFIENLQIFDFELSAEEMQLLDGLA